MHIDSWNKSTTSSTSQTSNPITFTYIIQIKHLWYVGIPLSDHSQKHDSRTSSIFYYFTHPTPITTGFLAPFTLPHPLLWQTIHHEYFDNKFDMFHWLLVPYISVDFDLVERHLPHTQTRSPRSLSRLLRPFHFISIQCNYVEVVPIDL